MPTDVGRFVESILELIKKRHGLSFDQDVVKLLPTKKVKSGKKIPVIAVATLRKWKAGMQVPELKKLDILIRLANPEWTVSKCLHVPGEETLDAARDLLNKAASDIPPADKRIRRPSG